MKDFDVIVVGAGVMGAATARALTKRGKSVLLMEQFVIGHKRGSSHGRSRIFRFSYPEARYVRMAQEALPMWRELEAESGQKLLRRTGGLDLGPGIEDNARALGECEANFELMTGTEVNGRFPMMQLPGEEPVLFQPDAGYVAADPTVMVCARSALYEGAELLENARVRSIDVSGERPRVATDDGTYRAERVVVTAGAWARALLESAGIDLPTRPTRETVAYFKLAGEPPPTLVEWGDPAVYALPSPGQGLKAAQHVAGPTTDPDEEGSPSETSVEWLSRWVAERYPKADHRPLSYETCLYTNSPDEHFILERHGDVVVGSPCSGHGFKFAPLIGERLADLATGE